jgi:hypothetical protein
MSVLAVKITHSVTFRLGTAPSGVNPLNLGTFSAVVSPSATGPLGALLQAAGARLDAAHGEWRVPVASYAPLFKSLCALHSCRVVPLPALVLHGLGGGAPGGGAPPGLLARYPEGHAVPLRVPASLLARMRGFQVEGVRFAVARGGRALLGDEMGCGKTLQAIAFAAHFREAWPLLVLAPAALRLNWREELLKWLEGHVAAENISVVLKGKEKMPASKGGGFSAGVVVVSYNAVSALTASRAITPGMFKVVIADESHQLKTQGSARTRAVLPLLHAARHVLLLSGTPLPNRPRELYSQLSAVNRNLFPDYAAYATRYCAARQASWGYDDGGASNTEELRALMQLHALIRRTKAEVLRDLPPKTRSTTRVPVTEEASEQLGALSKNLADLKERIRSLAPDDPAMEQLRQASRGLEMAIFKALGVGKAPFVVEHVFKNVLAPLPGRNFLAVPEAAVAPTGGRKRRGGGAVGGGARGGKGGCTAAVTAAQHEDLSPSSSPPSSGSESGGEGGEGRGRARVGAPRPGKRPRPGGAGGGAAEAAPPSRSASLPCSGGGFFGGEEGAAGASPALPAPSFFAHDALGGGGALSGGGGSGPPSHQRSIREALVSPVLSSTQPRAEGGGAPAAPEAPPPPAADAAAPLGAAKVQKLCIFAHHKDVLDVFARACTARGVRFVRVDGAADAPAKHRACKAFAEDAGVQVALLAIMAAGVGLSFTAARRAVFAELQFTPGDIMQAEDRIHRLGQTYPAHIEYCVSEGVPGDFDKRLWALLEKKVAVISRALEAGDAAGAAAAALRGARAPPPPPPAGAAAAHGAAGEEREEDDEEGDGDGGERAARELPLDVSLFGDEEEEAAAAAAVAAAAAAAVAAGGGAAGGEGAGEPPLRAGGEGAGEPPLRPPPEPLSDEALNALLDEMEAPPPQQQLLLPRQHQQPQQPPPQPQPKLQSQQKQPPGFWDDEDALLECLDRLDS